MGYSLDKVRDKQKDRRQSSGKTIYDAIFEEVPNKSILSIKVADLYSAPEKWNFFKDLDETKLYEMKESIKSEGLLNPIIVWKMDRAKVQDEYEHPTEDTHNFSGSSYMILAGHHRSLSFKELDEEEPGSDFSHIDAYVLTDITKEKAEYIVIATNYIQRELSKQDKRKSITYMYRTLRAQNYKKSEAVEKISGQVQLCPRQVQRETTIADSLVADFYKMYEGGQITQSTSLKLAKLSPKQQTAIITKYPNNLTNTFLSKADKNKIDKVGYDATFVQSSAVEMCTVSMKVPVHMKDIFQKRAQRLLKQIKEEYENV